MLSLFRHIIKYTHRKMAKANLAKRLKAFCRYLVYGRSSGDAHQKGAFENTRDLLEINNHLKISMESDMSTVTEYLEQEPNKTLFHPYLRTDCLFSNGICKFTELTGTHWLLSHIDRTVIDNLRDLDDKRHCIFIASLHCYDNTAQFTFYKGVDPKNEMMPVHVFYHSKSPILFVGTFEFTIAWDGINKVLTSSLNHENSFRIEA